MSAFRSNEVDAPALTGEAGSLIAVLDAVLVKGYGSRGGAGWTKPFSETHRAVYRNHYSGEAFCLAVDDRVGQHALIRGFRSMTSVSAGTQPYPSIVAPFSADGLRISKSETSDAVPRAWAIVTDAKGLYLWRHVGSSGWNEFSFGDIHDLCSAMAVCSLRDRLGAGQARAGIWATPLAEGAPLEGYEFTVLPGARYDIHNRTGAPQRVTVAGATSGMQVIADLSLGAHVSVVAGNENIQLTLESADTGYVRPQLVKA